jgi:SAM-dependent methyltransferase
MALPLCHPAVQYALQSTDEIAIPAPEEDGRIKTLNPEGGYMTAQNLGISSDFLNFCSPTLTHPVFDGGAAFGVATLAALSRGATVIANDIESRHLVYIARNGGDKTDRLYLREGALPGSLEFPENSLSAIHLSRVLHFLKPDEVVQVFENAVRALVPGGRLFIVIASPYHWCCEGFAETYEERFRAGERFPGVVDGAWKRKRFGQPQDDGSRLLVIDPRVMVRLADDVGFVVKLVQLMGQDESRFDYTGAILIKPPIA